jgi:hypothetical protein
MTSVSDIMTEFDQLAVLLGISGGLSAAPQQLTVFCNPHRCQNTSKIL